MGKTDTDAQRFEANKLMLNDCCSVVLAFFRGLLGLKLAVGVFAVCKPVVVVVETVEAGPGTLRREGLQGIARLSF